MSKEEKALFKDGEGKPLTPKSIQSPDTAMKILVLCAKYAYQQGLFKEMNDISVVNKAIEEATRYVHLQRYIIENYWNVIKEVAVENDKGEKTVKSLPIKNEELEVLETLTSDIIKDDNVFKLELIKTPTLQEGEEGNVFCMLNSSPWGLKDGQIVLRINGKIHVPLASNINDITVENK